LTELKSRFPVIGDVRGLGLMVGVEFTDPKTKKPAADTVKGALGKCFEDNLILMSCGTNGNTVRWIPPLNVTADQIEQGLRSFEKAVEKTVGGK